MEFLKKRNLLGKPITEIDKELWVGTEYEGQLFKRLDSWDIDSDYYYDSSRFCTPRYQMENGDIVAYNKKGKLIKI